MNFKDPYRVLGVHPSATATEVKEAYRGLAKKYHPDNYKDAAAKELAQEKMSEINAAYDMISSGTVGSNSQSGGGQNQQRPPWSDWTQGNAQSRGGYGQGDYGQNPWGQGGYYGRSRSGGCCDTLTCLCCADSCCECMGGDLVPCC